MKRRGKTCWHGCWMAALMTDALAAPGGSVRVVASPDPAGGANNHDAGNRAPLEPSPFDKLPKATVLQNRGPMCYMPFTQEGAPVGLRFRGRRIPKWTASECGMIGLLPAGPVSSGRATEDLILIPMGAARLRISSFPPIAPNPAE